MSKIGLNGRILSRTPRLCRSCSAEEEESEEVVFSPYTLVMIQMETLLLAACQNL